MNRLTKLAAVAAFAVSSVAAVYAADKTPDATFDLHGGAVNVGVGYTWGSGTLHYQGRDYPFSMSGANVLAIGGQEINVSGNVYHLKAIDDFAGNYSGVAAGAALVEGGNTGVMENHRGVVIRFTSETSGVNLELAGNTLEVKMGQ
jgi:hypothetical protein